MSFRSRVSITRYPPVPNCTRCDNLLVGRGDDMPAYSVQGYRTGVWLAEFLCEPCARDTGQVRPIFDALAERRTNLRDWNRWGVSYFQVREAYRRANPDNPAPLEACDARIIGELGDDPEVLFQFANSQPGYYFGRAVLFGVGEDFHDPELDVTHGADAPARFMALYRTDADQ